MQFRGFNLKLEHQKQLEQMNINSPSANSQTISSGIPTNENALKDEAHARLANYVSILQNIRSKATNDEFKKDLSVFLFFSFSFPLPSFVTS